MVMMESGSIHATVEFGRPEGEIVGSIEMGVIPREFFHSFGVGQARPVGFFLAEKLSESFVVGLGIDRVFPVLGWE